MARLSPRVHGATLVYQQQGQDQALQVGTPDWFAWLATASTFAFRDECGTFTARKERAGNQRGGWYWKAYRTQHGRLASIYLGKSEALTLACLHAAATTLGRTSGVAGEAGGRVATAAPSPTRVWEDPLLATKLHMPRLPSHLVPRAHLTVRLQQALQRPLTLIAAPAGFGDRKSVV
jgi:LuxR family transcriptional regulator, maltose regulon positive regulatory protein